MAYKKIERVREADLLNTLDDEKWAKQNMSHRGLGAERTRSTALPYLALVGQKGQQLDSEHAGGK